MERTKFIGGSDCAGVLGLSRWQTPLSIWAEKTGQIAPKELDNEAVELGKELEDYVARRFEKKTGKKVRRINKTLFHEKYDFIGANLDRDIIGEDAFLECKTASAWKAREWEGQEIPQEYILQCLHYLAVTGYKYCYIAVLIGNQDFKWKRIDRDDKMINNIIEQEVYFWNTFVIPKVMPMNIKRQDSITLQELFPYATKIEPIKLGDNALKLAEQLESYNEDLKALEGYIEKMQNELKALLKDNESAEVGEFSISWKNQERTTLDSKKIKENEPEFYKKYSKTNNIRVFRCIKKES
jgi:putative phage-type endonuclease